MHNWALENERTLFSLLLLIYWTILQFAVFCMSWKSSGDQEEHQPQWNMTLWITKEKKRNLLLNFRESSAVANLKVSQIWNALCNEEVAGRGAKRRLWIPPELISSSSRRPLRDVLRIISNGLGLWRPPEELTGITGCILVLAVEQWDNSGAVRALWRLDGACSWYITTNKGRRDPH